MARTLPFLGTDADHDFLSPLRCLKQAVGRARQHPQQRLLPMRTSEGGSSQQVAARGPSSRAASLLRGAHRRACCTCRSGRRAT
eukprot:6202446-Pleurochrysis_carterae.AAC.3